MSAFNNILGSLTKAGIEQFGRLNLPVTNGKFKLKGLHKKVEIIRDEWGIPHIYAKNMNDLSFAQGYVHAQDRFWQMELNRRVAQGTMSEIFGRPALELDIASRTIGFNRLAKEDLKLLPPKLKKLLTAYTAGINAYLEQKQERGISIEFRLVQYKLQKWTMLDTLAFSRLLAWQLSHGWQAPLLRAELIEAIGLEKMQEIDILYDANNPSILTHGNENYRIKQSATIKGLESEFLRRGEGSNSWAVAGNKTTTGKPILANDPHLSMRAPAIWYENHLHCPSLHTTGVTIAGSPLILIGHNQHISWGATLAFTDCEDIYIEKFHPDNPTQYEFKGEWKQAKTIDEPIHIRGEGTPHIETVVYTNHGPIISDLLDNPNHRVALRSMALQPGQTLRGWWQLNHAQNWTDFVEAMSFIDAPQLNMVYADVHGDIGYWVTGRVPVRSKSDGQTPMIGWTGENEWIGQVPFMEMPHALNPEKDYVLTCNNKIPNDDYPHFLGNLWINGYRARRLTDLIDQKKKISLLDCQQMQMDIHSIPAQQLAKLYQKYKNKLQKLTKDTRFKQALAILTNWDGQMNAEGIAPALYGVLRYKLLETLFAEQLDEALMPKLRGIGFHPVLNPANEFSSNMIPCVFRLLENPKESWWVQEAGGAVAVLRKSLENTLDWLENTLGSKELKNWHWGKLHRIVFAHAMGIRKPLDRIFNVGPLPMDGGVDTPLHAQEGDRQLPNNLTTSASYRQVIDLSDWTKCQAVMPPGQSGHIASPHYTSQLELWQQGKLRPMLWTREQVDIYGVDRLVLQGKKKNK